MLIRKINSVFMRHSRWLFGIFTIVIIVSFLGFLTPGQFGVGGCAEPGQMKIGVAFGQNVTYNDLRNQMEAMSVFYRVAYGVNIREVKPQEAFEMLCLRLGAERRGIVVSDGEIADMLKTLPIFAESGKFDYAKYKSTMENLRRQGIDGDMVARSMRNMLVQQKLMQEMMSSVVVANGEVEQFYRQLNEKIQVKVADFNRNSYAKEVKIKAAGLKSYFETHRAAYKIPAQLTAEVVEFSFTSPEALKTAATVSESEIRAYYDKNKTTLFSKNGKAEEYNKVKPQVKSSCIAEKIRTSVMRKAQQFAAKAYDVAGEKADKRAAFRKLAADNKLTVTNTGRFPVNSGAAGKIAEPEFVRQLAGVYSVPVTNAVAGAKAAYVGFVVEQIPERDAEFNEVALKVQDDFIRESAVKLAVAGAEAEAKKLSAMPVAQRAAAKCWDKTIDFTLAEPPTQEIGQLIAAVAPGLAAGDISPAMPQPDGAMLLMVVKRAAGDMKDFAKNKSNYEMMWRQMKLRSVQSDFINYVQSQCIFEMEK